MKNFVICAILCQAAALAGAQQAATGQARHAAAFRCGGIGEGEQEQFKREAASHDAMVSFATPGGAYVADVDVKVSRADGTVLLQGACGGPLMLLDVPAAGNYRIDAAFAGRQQHKDVHLGQRPARVSFVWSDG